MKTSAFQRIYSRIETITKATCMVEAEGVTNEDMAYVDGRPAQVVVFPSVSGDSLGLPRPGSTAAPAPGSRGYSDSFRPPGKMAGCTLAAINLADES